jgi:hypothetical protein
MRTNSRYFIFWAGMLFTTVMFIFLWYANHTAKIKVKSIELRKSTDLVFSAKSVNNKNDTEKIRSNVINIQKIPNTDTVSHKILLIGDSQVEGLRIPFYDYCAKNKDTLLLAAMWYSSTDVVFASNDTLKNIIARYKPDYILFVIGLNEIFFHEFDEFNESRMAIKKIINTFNGIPYSWIGPANWTPDRGINDLYQQEVDSGCFFLSKNLVLSRANDHRHPSSQGYRIWMDTIGRWLNNNALWRLKMDVPDSIATMVKHRNINNWMAVAE